MDTVNIKLKILDVGGNDGLRARKQFPNAEIEVIDKKHGWDVMQYGLPAGPWDVIFANHIIEHLENPDFFLEECKRQMKHDTILEIGTPNLTAWFNRFFFLLGYVPHSMELSKEFNVGKPLNWNDEPLGGHIFIYTIPALLQLLKHHGFKVKSVEGECSTFPASLLVLTLDKLLTRVNPNLASAFRIKCTI